MKKLPLPFDTTLSDYILNNPQSLINLYPVIAPAGSKNKFYLVSREGLRKLLEFKDKILGLRGFDDYLYVVTSKAIYRISKNLKLEKIGDVDFPVDRQVYIESNGFQMIFVGGKVYVYNKGQLKRAEFNTGDDLPTSSSVAFLAGYFILSKENSGQFYWSDLYNVTFDPANYATAEGSPDKLLGVLSDGKKLYLFGSNTLEVWYASGDSYVFRRIRGAFGSPGTIDFKTVQRINDYVFFVGSDGNVYVASGMEKRKISNEYIEKRLSETGYKNLSSCAFIIKGLHFYCLNLYNNETFCFNLETKTWHKRLSPYHNRWIVEHATVFNNKVYASDYEQGIIYEVDKDYYLDDEHRFIKELNTVTIYNNQEWFTLDAVEVEMNGADLMRDDKIYLSYSETGREYETLREGSIAGWGELKHRVIFRRLGRHRNLTLRFFTSAPRKIEIINLWGVLHA